MFLGCSNFPNCRYTFDLGERAFREPPPEKQRPNEVAMEDWIPDCPICGEPMLLKENLMTKKQFWGCRDFPDCRGIKEVKWPTPVGDPFEDEKVLK